MALDLYLLLPILATLTHAKMEEKGSNSETPLQTIRYARSAHPQNFQTNFDPISDQEVRDHFGLTDAGVMFVGSGEVMEEEQFQKLTRITTPMRNTQRLLPVENFPEESKSRRNDPVLIDFLKIKATQGIVQSSQSQRPRTSKPITNLLLQKLFNRKSIPVSNTPISSATATKQTGPGQSSSETISLFERIKKRINEDRNQDAKAELQASSTGQQDTHRAQSSLLRDQILKQKQKQDKEISKILDADQARIQKESDLEQKQTLFDVLLAEKKEREKLLTEALVKQKAQKALAKIRAEEDEDRIKMAKEAEKKRKLVEEEMRQEQLAKKSQAEGNASKEAIGRASAAVQRRKAVGSEKSSPAVWAAVRALTQFVEGKEDRDREVPQDIIMAVIQLTDFLDMDGGPITATVSVRQQRLRDQILKQRQQQEKEIANILKAETVETFMRRTQSTTPSSSFEFKKVVTRVPFPARVELGKIKLQDTTAGSAFSFSTLPVL